MNIFKTHPQQYKDAQLYQWLLDGLYNTKDQAPMEMMEHKSQWYVAKGVGMVYSTIVDLQKQVTCTLLLEDE